MGAREREAAAREQEKREEEAKRAEEVWYTVQCLHRGGAPCTAAETVRCRQQHKIFHCCCCVSQLALLKLFVVDNNTKSPLLLCLLCCHITPTPVYFEVYDMIFASYDMIHTGCEKSRVVKL